MKRTGRVLAVLTALILTANLAFTCYAQENSDGSSESTGEKSNETITITGGIETRIHRKIRVRQMRRKLQKSHRQRQRTAMCRKEHPTLFGGTSI
ncbi:MAG: hypothetical protein ACLVJO_02265 [[Clostridium] scindens]